jgi:hypothetical protein
MLTGTFTVGGSSPDFPTVAAATSSLMSLGICGPVTFLVRDGTYPGINIGIVTGSSALNTITFRSASGNRDNVILLASNINGTDYITVRDVTLQGSSSGAIKCLTISGGAEHNHFLNDKLTNYKMSAIGSSADNYMIIDSCLFTCGAEIGGASSTNRQQYLKIRYNEFINPDFGLWLSNIDSVDIIGNTMNNSLYAGNPAIYIQSSVGKCRIHKNRVFGQFPDGIVINNVDAASGSETEIWNNVLSSTRDYFDAIAIGSSEYINVYHNSVMLQGSSANGISFAGTVNYRSYNNAVQNLSNSWTYFLNNPTVPPTVYSSDYNVFFSYTSYPFYYGGTNYASLPAFSAVSGSDTHSLFIDPQFTSFTDLFPMEVALFGAGSPQGVLTDINNNPRSLTAPAIGAYEAFAAPSVSLGVDSLYCTSAFLNAATPGASYNWSTGASTPNITVSASGTYWVTASNAFGTDSDTVNITIASPPVATLTADEDSVCITGCASLNVTATGGTGPYTYSWTPASEVSDPSISNPEVCTSYLNYQAVVTDINGCSDSTWYYLEPPAPIGISTNGDQLICLGTSVQLIAYGSEPGYSYEWTPASSLTNPLDSSTYASPTTVTFYTVTATDSYGCSASVQVVVEVMPPSSNSISQSGGYLISNVSAISYQWYLNGNPVPGANDQTYLFTSNGSYTVEITEWTGCITMSPPYVITSVGIESLSAQAGMQVMPNPASDKFFCYITISKMDNAAIELTDLTGKILLSQHLCEGENKLLFDVSKLATGMYLVNERVDGIVIASQKLVVE